MDKYKSCHIFAILKMRES
uniref:Uncharacterized protein n=1 Tax=Rhizophora mucronata TaxID=61149 RepID=A0A2P2PL06_RHIMU